MTYLSLFLVDVLHKYWRLAHGKKVVDLFSLSTDRGNQWTVRMPSSHMDRWGRKSHVEVVFRRFLDDVP